MPPMAGLQDISPKRAALWVMSSVRAPRRADAAAASQPAWPPPMIMTSCMAKDLAELHAGRERGDGGATRCPIS